MEKEGNEIQHSKAHSCVGEAYIFRMRQSSTVNGEYNNGGSLGKSTRLLIVVRNIGKNEHLFQTTVGGGESICVFS